MRIGFTIVVLAVCGLGACSSGGGTGARDSRQQDVVVADSAALALVEEYLKRDARGEFIQPSEWLSEVANFEIPRYEAMTLIRSYEVLAQETRGDTTRITVQYDVTGVMPADLKLSRTDSVDLQTFVVVSTEEGVRLTGPRLNPHVSLTAVPEDSLAREEGRRALEEAARRESGRAAGDSCQEAAVVADSAALALVEEYLKRDARGEFRGVSEWRSENTIRAGWGGDMMSIISGYQIVAAETRCDTTRVTVHWDVVGGVSTPGPTLEPQWTLTDSVDVWTFIVLSTEEGPRLTGDLIYPHMSARVILERNFADEEYRRALEEALRRKGG
jgi:hypothetical protein